jgi:hypothetical protein
VSRHLLPRLALLAVLSACAERPVAPTAPPVESLSAVMSAARASRAVARATSANNTGRFQMGVTAYHIAVFDLFVHDFVVMMNSCDGSIDITGGTPVNSGYFTTETVTGTLVGGKISFRAVYNGPFSPGFSWTGNFAADKDGLLSGDYWGSVTVTSSSMTSYRNHGEYVANSANKNDAAHSCIGMPLR